MLLVLLKGYVFVYFGRALWRVVADERMRTARKRLVQQRICNGEHTSAMDIISIKLKMNDSKHATTRR